MSITGLFELRNYHKKYVNRKDRYYDLQRNKWEIFSCEGVLNSIDNIGLALVFKKYRL